jgi:transcriptional regulator with XRE-family HTH domain
MASPTATLALPYGYTACHNIAMSFGSLLKSAREAAGLSQRDLATLVGISHYHLSKIESESRRPPRMQTALDIVAALELTPNEGEDLLASGGYAPQAIQRHVRSVRRVSSEFHRTSLPGLLAAVDRLDGADLPESTKLKLAEALAEVIELIVGAAVGSESR